ncbi:DNA2-like helicase, partial [Stegodyphus mimosarum]
MNENKISDFVSGTSLGCDNDFVTKSIDETYNSKEDAGQSFSWFSDISWEGMEDNSAENNIEGCGHSKECNVRYKVKELNRENPNEVKLILNDPDPNVTNLKTCVLRGFWMDTLVNDGDFVNVLEDFKNKQAVIDDNNGFLVVNPDFLVSSTAVVSTLFCMRKAVLNYILPKWSPGNSIMIIGSLVHDIFQQAVNKHVNSAEEIVKIIEKVMKKQENLLSLCCQNLTEEEIKEKVIKFVPHIYDWIIKYCNFSGKSGSESIQVTEIRDIEDNVWCPKFGIKGKIDLTVNAVLRNQSIPKLMPLELKTGRPTFSAEHVGQVNLYSLMLEERTKEVSDGLLLYLRDGVDMKVIQSNHNSRRGLIQLRNELAFYAHKWSACALQENEDIEMCHLPNPINDKRLCEKCPYLLPCTVYQSAFSGVNSFETSHAMKNLVPMFTSHLNNNDLEYFKKWSYLLQLESSNNAEGKAFWDEDAVSREKQGMCLSWVCLARNQSVRQEIEDGFFVHTFCRSSNSPENTGFNIFGLKEGDYVAISNQENPDEVAIAMGYIVKTHEYFVEVAIERDLNTVTRYKDCVFRIDKQISSSSTAYIRNNLVHLMADDNRATKLRKFIIQKQEPQFLSSLPKQVVLIGRPILKSLNKIQQKTVLKALMAEDYFLIKGMPGTGKTTTIVALVRLMVKMGISVLLTSYTHSAIDNILLKLMGHTEFVRIGPKARIHPDIKQYAFENLTRDFSSVEDFTTFMKERMVVATTCLSVNHEIFHIRKFDVCIIDEASQINQIACLGPIFHATKFILVGDDKQLPPLVINDKARLLGMQESLFQRLQNSKNCMELVIQYRMNE